MINTICQTISGRGMKKNCTTRLRLAFYRRDMQSANEVRLKTKKFTVLEWIRYTGAKSVIIHYGYRAVAFLCGPFRQEHNYWM